MSTTLAALPSDVQKVANEGVVKLFGKWDAQECVLERDREDSRLSAVKMRLSVQGQKLCTLGLVILAWHSGSLRS